MGPRSWEAFAREHGHLGVTCTVLTEREKCGNTYVCKMGICSECTLSRDCGEQYRCEPSTTGRKWCVPRNLVKHWNWPAVWCTVLIIFTAMLSAAAGMGGGGVYVPLLLLLLGLSTQEAVPLSQAMIVGGATVNVVMLCGERHPKFPHRPKIDYDVIMMLNPGLAAGVTVGVICNVISPQWLIVVVLLATLVIALQKSVTKGISQWKKESKALADEKAMGGNSAPKHEPLQLKLTDFTAFKELASANKQAIKLIAGCWVAFFASNVFKAAPCTPTYWYQLFGLLVVCSLFTAAGSSTLRENVKSNESSEGMLAWTPTTMWMYPLLSTVAGFLGGFLGIGGGIIMGPLLLELGMAPEASQATTAMFVFLSSSLATIQFVVLGKAMPQYALWFTLWVILATIVGQTLVDHILRRWQRSSPIVLAIAAIIAGSLVMMTFIGAKDIYIDINRGAEMGFVQHHLCE